MPPISPPTADQPPFVGAKAALFIGARLLVLLRDDLPGLRWAGHWDFPGGGRDGDETPFQTLAREIDEEIGLDVDPQHIVWQWSGPSAEFAPLQSWFFVVQLPAGAERTILMGDEGGAWALMPPARFLALEDAVPSMQARLRLWMDRPGAA